MMRVLYSFPMRLGTSGTGMTAWHQVSGLVGQGVSVTVCCASCEKDIPGVQEVHETLKWGPVYCPIRVVGRNRACSLHDRVVARRLRSKRADFDIVHCWPSGSLSTLKVAKSMGIASFLERPSAHTRYVFEVAEKECRGLGMDLNRAHYARTDARRLAREEQEFALADKLLCPSEFVLRTFRDEGFDASRPIRHQYGYDPNKFHCSDLKSRRTYDAKFTMVYVGDCYPLKGLHYALKAWVGSNASKNGRFLICGRMDDEYKAVIEKELRHPSVECLGFREDVQDVMCQAHALVLASLAEGSALVTYEAMACGCVLLVSSASGAVCQHMKDGLVHEPGDVETLRHHIDLLATDRALHMKLQESSLCTISKYTWEAAGGRLREIYESFTP